MIQSTSAETYRDLEDRGVLKGQRLEVLRAFQRFGPGTSAEVLRAAALDQNRNLARARVTELADSGLLTEQDSRHCNVTGRRAIVWSAQVGEPRERVYRVALTEADVQAMADFQSGKAGQFSEALRKAHQKVLDGAGRVDKKKVYDADRQR